MDAYEDSSEESDSDNDDNRDADASNNGIDSDEEIRVSLILNSDNI